MNETSAVAAATTTTTTTLEVSELKALQDILHNRIMQKKEEVHEYHSEAYTGILSRYPIKEDRTIALVSCADTNS